MKKYIFFFVLFSSFGLAQPSADRYEDESFKYTLDNYPNFYQELILSDIIYTGFDDPTSTQSIGSISINNNILSLNISKTWPQQAFKVGIIKHLDVYPILPNVDLGPILNYGGAGQTGYNARIENNDIIIYSSYFVDNLSTATPITLSSYIEDNEFPFLGINGSGNVSINQNKLSFNYNIDLWSLDPNPSGIIYTFPEWVDRGNYYYFFNIPNTELGILQNNGRNTVYKGKVENNQLVIYSTENLPGIPTGCSLNFAYDLNTHTAPMWYRDADHDGYGSPYDTASGTATPPAGYVSNNTDCDDSNAAINPESIWYRDQDGDSYGSVNHPTITGCLKPYGYVLRGSDCNDDDTTISPETVWFKNSNRPNIYYPEITSCIQPPGYTDHYGPVGTGPGSLPGECIDPNGMISNPETVWYYDGDSDGYGTNSNTVKGCIQPLNYVSNNLDCNDNDSSLNPTSIWYQDQDGDGYGSPASTASGCLQPSGYVRNALDYDDGTSFIINIAPQYFFYDADGDGFGNPNLSVYYSIQPANYVLNNTDCNDSDQTLNPNTIWYLDADGDGYGTITTSTKNCTQPTGYVRNSSDYDDTTNLITNIAPQFFYQDADGDGFGNPNSSVYYSVQPANYVTNNYDCDDTNIALNPNTIWYSDADGDSYGSSTISVRSCNQPIGYVLNSSDYDDSTTNINNIAPQIFYQDSDGDGFGNPNVSLYYSAQPANYVTNNSDYDDTTTNITNIAPQIFYLDNDGDGYGNPNISVYYSVRPAKYVTNNFDYDDTTTNITNIAPQTFYYDEDGDGYGNPNLSIYYSIKPSNYVTNNTDCNDSDIAVNPNTKWYLDADGDSYGSSTVFVASCTQPLGYVMNSSDYDDSTTNINNIAPQFFYQDSDGDGFGNPNASVYYSTQPANYVGNNSDYDDTTTNITNIAPQTFYFDNDGDGYGNPNISVYYSVQPINYVTNKSDYDDTTTNITNIAPQRFYHDGDGDGFGNPDSSVYYSVKPLNYVTNNTDCNDNDIAINPNTKWYADNDSDGFGDPANYLQQCTSPSEKHVLNNSDNCPLVAGTSTDCESLANPLLSQNYIITKIYKKPTKSVFISPTPDQATTNITYFDGIGRPIQQISQQQSASGTDIVTHIDYDILGRLEKNYLPYVATSTNMEFQEDAAAKTIDFYNVEKYGNTSKPFSQKRYETSPLGRILKQSAPGVPWEMDSGHEIKMDYQTNKTSDEVRHFKATSTWDENLGLYDISFADQGHYDENELYKTIFYDENTLANPVESSGSSIEFKNKEGNIVLKRTYESGTKHDTYYVYDIAGNLTYIIPPKADGEINDEVRKNLCYQYKYDYRNRLVEKKLPGKQWYFVVYDKLDRLVATGPAFSPFKEDASVGWVITKYDIYDRLIYTGWTNQSVNSSTRKSLQNIQNSTTLLYESKTNSGTIDEIPAYYTNGNEPTNFKLLTVNYYDNYDFPNASDLPSLVLEDTVLINTKGLSTGKWTRVLTSLSEKFGETTTLVYDGKGRLIRNHNQNYLGGYTYLDNKIDFAGKLLYNIEKHKYTLGINEIKIKEDFIYSQQDRLLTQTHQVNDGAIELLAHNEYSDLGQLIWKITGQNINNPLQKIDFLYNVRGWLTDINKVSDLQQDTDPEDLFAYKLNYTNEPENSQIKALFNGNIAQTFWKTGSDNLERGYGYQYDKLNRLTNAVYEKNGLVTNAYDESLTYDKNGNIESLIRNGTIDPQLEPLEIDHLTYNYLTNSNQLLKVTDGPSGNDNQGFIDTNKIGDDFGYDDNGNLTSDKNKNITEIQYNHLNLPKKIFFGSTSSIDYIYNAVGHKLEKKVVEGASTITTNYSDGFQYKDNVLKFFPTSEGYVTNNNNVFSYVFQYKDHLGNIRLSYAKNPTTQDIEIIEENNYYPYGLKHTGYNPSNEIENNEGLKYKFNGKELQEELGLNMTAMDYRQYDNTLGRFNCIDALAEMNYSTSPFAFSYNNPIYWADPSGLISASFAQSLWDNSQNGQNTLWENDGGGTFSNANGSGMVDSTTGEYTPFESLRAVTITGRKTSGGGSHFEGNLGGLAQSKAYSFGRFYEGWRSDFRTKQADGVQEWFEWLGSADPSGVVDGINSLGYLIRGQTGNAAIAAIAIVPYVGDLAKGVKYTKSTMKIGREVHLAYKAAEHAPELGKFKEFARVPGIRPDFVDFTTKTIYELKPFNPRAVKAGEKQLKNYKTAMEKAYPGTIWTTVLDTY